MGDEELAARAQEERERAQRTAEAKKPPGAHGRELELKRVPGDRRLYAMEGVGTLRLAGFGPATAATAGGTFWIAGRGFWGVVIQATDAAGTAVGEFRPSRLRRGGGLRWADLELTLRRAGFWRQRYVLADGDRELAVLGGKGWDRLRVTVTIDDAGAIEPGLLLFAPFVVRQLAARASRGGAGVGWG